MTFADKFRSQSRRPVQPDVKPAEIEAVPFTTPGAWLGGDERRDGVTVQHFDGTEPPPRPDALGILPQVAPPSEAQQAGEAARLALHVQKSEAGR